MFQVILETEYFIERFHVAGGRAVQCGYFVPGKNIRFIRIVYGPGFGIALPADGFIRKRERLEGQGRLLAG